MPQANVWIARENWETWDAIPNKSRFINYQLRKMKHSIVQDRVLVEKEAVDAETKTDNGQDRQGSGKSREDR